MVNKYAVAVLAAGGGVTAAGLALYFLKKSRPPAISLEVVPSSLPYTGGSATLTVSVQGIAPTVTGHLLENGEEIATFLLNGRFGMTLDLPPNGSNAPVVYGFSVAASGIITSGTVEVVVQAESYGVTAITLSPTPATITGPGTVDIVASVTPSSGVTTTELNAAGYTVTIYGGPGSVGTTGAAVISAPTPVGTVAVDASGEGTVTVALQAPVTGSTGYFFYAQGPSAV